MAYKAYALYWCLNWALLSEVGPIFLGSIETKVFSKIIKTFWAVFKCFGPNESKAVESIVRLLPPSSHTAEKKKRKLQMLKVVSNLLRFLYNQVASVGREVQRLVVQLKEELKKNDIKEKGRGGG